MVCRSAAGVCLVRDARDIIPFVCGHYLRAGFAHLAFVDDGSSDGTFEFLSSLSSATDRVSVRKVARDRFEQELLMNETTNALIGAGYQIVIPFDADEFWDIRAEELKNRYAAENRVAFFGRWANFVQQRYITTPRPFGLFRISYRAAPIQDASQETVSSFRRPFVCFSEKKVAFKTDRPVQLTLGQHFVQDLDTDSREVEIFHVPLRYRSEIEKRGLNYEPRRAKARTHHSISWQSRFHRQVILSNRVEDVWAANSASRDGHLDAYGKRISLVRDGRFRKLLFKASAYLARTVGRVPY
jgi:hypothetical protein